MNRAETSRIYGGDATSAWLLYPEADLNDQSVPVEADCTAISFKQISRNEAAIISVRENKQRGWHVSTNWTDHVFWIESSGIDESEHLPYLAGRLEELAGKKVVILLK